MIDFSKISIIEWTIGCFLFAVFLVSLWRLLRANVKTHEQRSDLENYQFPVMKSRRN